MCKKSLKTESETVLYQIPYRQVVKRGCDCCLDMVIIRKIPKKHALRGCPHLQCPYRELDPYKTYTEYLKNTPWNLNRPKYGKQRFVTINGKTQNLSQWAKEIGMKKDTVYRRIKNGMTEREALGFFGYDENDENE